MTRNEAIEKLSAMKAGESFSFRGVTVQCRSYGYHFDEPGCSGPCPRTVLRAVMEMWCRNMLDVVPKVGDGATLHYVSDRVAHTVVRVSKSGKTVWLGRDRSTVVSGSAADGSAEYEHEHGTTEDRVARLTTRKSGRRAWRSGGQLVSMGYRSAYRDPHF
jgi:hypothetical protein